MCDGRPTRSRPGLPRAGRAAPEDGRRPVRRRAGLHRGDGRVLRRGRRRRAAAARRLARAGAGAGLRRLRARAAAAVRRRRGTGVRGDRAGPAAHRPGRAQRRRAGRGRRRGGLQHHRRRPGDGGQDHRDGGDGTGRDARGGRGRRPYPRGARRPGGPRHSGRGDQQPLSDGAFRRNGRTGRRAADAGGQGGRLPPGEGPAGLPQPAVHRGGEALLRNAREHPAAPARHHHPLHLHRPRRDRRGVGHPGVLVGATDQTRAVLARDGRPARVGQPHLPRSRPEGQLRVRAPPAPHRPVPYAPGAPAAPRGLARAGPPGLRRVRLHRPVPVRLTAAADGSPPPAARAPGRARSSTVIKAPPPHRRRYRYRHPGPTGYVAFILHGTESIRIRA
ncbi:hypothetical protein SCOCK_70115 [Actinacidiphila cocklensis]|uniref:Uncharacterized protein n=1 Tax=Actinacidiphila cocklensis TaxID=887465 RepID=A0A9W4DVH5_9ACTN|nr:hypothetical protein SCOCK_70115 [Actinacidiphila cocklensis]